MTLDETQDAICNGLAARIGYLCGPWPIEPRWWQFRIRRRESRIQKALNEAGLPRLTPEGRIRYYEQGPQGFEDAGGHGRENGAQL
jgi:hypothetical protein